jgi:PBP1b-binding outer membrane lipoprotein LpoB
MKKNQIVITLASLILMSGCSQATNQLSTTATTQTTPTSDHRQVLQKEPSIGMTALELSNSRWGIPNNIINTTTGGPANKTTASQKWVYSGYRYVYLENNVVTAIQE